MIAAVLLATHIGSSYAAAQVPVGTIAFEACFFQWDLNEFYCVTYLGTGHSFIDYAKNPTWSPDGSRIAFASPTGISIVNVRDWSTVRLSVAGESPAWSPDGSKLAFSAGELYVMNSDGSNVVQLTHGVGFLGESAWSPDGQTIAFDCEIETANRDICVIHADGTGLTRLTTDVNYDAAPAFSPDGLKIAFAVADPDYWPSSPSRSPTVFAMNADGTGRMPIGPGDHPAWSPDGARIAVALGTVGCPEEMFRCMIIATMNADGTAVATVGGFGDRPAWGVASGPIAWMIANCRLSPCTFDASGSFGGDRGFAGYTWDFGDGTNGSGQAVSHEYAAYGTYSVKLTVTDTAGVTATHAVTVVHANVPPTPSFAVACSGLTCAVDASASFDGNGSLTGYLWTFGDGTGGTGVTASHTYTSSGSYPVRLSVTDNDGASTALTRFITVSAPVPPPPLPPPPAPLHVGNLHGASTSFRNAWTATATATIHDGGHANQANVVVSGAWSDGGTRSCTTNQDGRCIVTRTDIGKRTSSISFTVTGVARPMYVYDSQQNHDPDGNSNGTRITLVKP
ncbi:PKD domain-containing protein [Luteitalea pratensis]|uniref:PKD domain-containing protein n=1 Tax=Luteitalea pratensis TaxID=1855912 RepID=UPI00138FCA8A|nr:PKD domain-containing protein [Luteitalea pratensis]